MPLITREYGPNAKGKKLTIKEMDDNLLYLESIATSGTAGTGGTAGTSGTSGTSGAAGATGTSGTSGISGTSGSSGTSGISGTSGSSGTSGIVPSTNSYGLFAQTVNGNTISNTITETSVVGAGVGTLAVPGGGFTIGDSFHAKMAGHLSCNNGVTITVRIKAGSIVLADSGPFSLSTATNQHWDLNMYFTIRDIGVPGIAEIFSSGSFTYVKNSGNTLEGTDFSLVNNTTFDTTISNTLDVTIEWGAASSGNSIYSEQLILTKIF